MSNNSNQASGGVGIGGLLLVLFIGLKLAGYIDWSWWWVLSPMWIPFALVLAGLLICGVLEAIIS